MDTSKIRTFFRNWILAGTAGTFVRTVTCPIERVKIIIQTQDLSPQFRELGIHPYKGFWDCFNRVRQEQGLLSYWRGNFANMVRYLPSVAFSFAFNDLFKEYIAPETLRSVSLINRLGREMLCGALAGFSAHTLVQPIRLCHTLMCADVSSCRVFTGLSNCILRVYNRYGISGLYSGYSCSVFGMSLYRSVYFGIFKTSKYYAESYYGSRPPFIVMWPLAQVGTLLAGCLSYPLDTISRNQQMSLYPCGPGGSQRSLTETVRQLIQSKGLFALYKGVSINSVRSVGSSLVLVLYDEIQFRFFRSKEKDVNSLVTFEQRQYWKTQIPGKGE
ncbi:ADP,ATP carrier protein [Gryllus bimaculatus]|nr:ADP,ATP carrier protein [Gryllus bimaculatus]